VWQPGPEELASLRPRLAEILVDCVERGASVGFLAPLEREEAETFWERVERAVEGGRRVVLLAALDGEVVGTVQLELAQAANQPHRGTVSKLLVHTDARRRGIGEELMRALEPVALDAGRWLLVLDTATAEAERLYERLGWSEAGVVPDYALNPDSSPTQTRFYWKRLQPRQSSP
jgi:GNAT superfamily N-acetyltransferase